jgi:cupin 2 domain-containing protein
MKEIIPGRCRHYKGKEYTVLGTAQHSETLDELVVYRQEYGEHGLWVRPKGMFLENVTVAGQEVARFQHLESTIQSSPESKNLFQDLPVHLPAEVSQTLLTAAQVRIERIISHGHASPEGFWYDQDQHEWVVVLRGAARLRFEDANAILNMQPGDCVNIPAHQKHRVEWTPPNEPTIWLAVHYGGSS